MPADQTTIIHARPGTARSAGARRKALDANIRDIFEQEAKKGDALRKALRYMAENNPESFVYAYLKLLGTQQTSSPIQNVTNVFAEQINAPRVIAHMEELVNRSASNGHATPVPNEPVLLADNDSETH